MNNTEIYFKNNFTKSDKGVYILSSDDDYADNFGKQWKRYRDVQIDSLNGYNLSKKFLENILFDSIDILKDKSILEVGCGAGRFTEHIVKKAKICYSVDLSSAIYENISKENKNLILIKSDLMKLIPNNKFDIVICRGVIQHTPNPLETIKKLLEFINEDGYVFFDVYPMPKLGLIHPKYLIWRPLIKKIFTYEEFDKFLNKNIKILLKIKRGIKKISFKSNFISDSIIPIWDYKDRIDLDENSLEKWSILDTLDGIYAHNDKPQSYKKMIKFLKKNKCRNYQFSKKIKLF